MPLWADIAATSESAGPQSPHTCPSPCYSKKGEQNTDYDILPFMNGVYKFSNYANLNFIFFHLVIIMEQ